MKLPDLATTGSAVKIVRWLREPGQAVRRGQPLLEIETDKATMEVEATVDGELTEVSAPAGAEVVTGDLIAVITVPDEPARGAARSSPESAPAAPAASSPATTPESSARSDSGTTGASRKGSLFARNRQAAGLSTEPASKDLAGLLLSPAQRVAAQRLQASKQTIPHFYLERSACADGLVARRNASPDARLLWDAFFVHAVSQALAAFRFAEDHLEPIESDAIGVAVDLLGELFVVALDAPVTKSVEALSQELRAAVDALRTGDPAARRLRPGRITLSNLGSTGVERFIAIVNPPEAAILAIGAIRPVVVPRGEAVVVEQRVALTLSVDHRVVSGRYAAEFLAAIVATLEKP
jgi:pyruvate dehydrogenase E2 component (dihydrolipoamide acetyltransferase)